MPARLPARTAKGRTTHRRKTVHINSDIVFDLLTLAYAPQLADLPDQKMWRIDRTTDYGAVLLPAPRPARRPATPAGQERRRRRRVSAGAESRTGPCRAWIVDPRTR